MTTNTSLICFALLAATSSAHADSYSGVLRTDIVSYDANTGIMLGGNELDLHGDAALEKAAAAASGKSVTVTGHMITKPAVEDYPQLRHIIVVDTLRVNVTLGSLVPKAARVKVREGKTGFDITKAADIAALEKSLHADDAVLAMTPRCLTPQTLEFDDASGKVLGTVGFCDGPNGIGGYEQPPVFLDAKRVATHGLPSADAPALEKILLKYRKAP